MGTMRLDQILAELSDTEAARLLELIEAGAPNADIARILTRHGYPIGETSIRRWKAKC